MFEIKGKYTTAKVMIDNVEESCISQITSFVNHPAFTNPVSIMPDTHAGKGSVIGFCMKMIGKIVPNVVGVDISCGMLAIDIGKELPLSKELIDHRIRKRVPMGFNIHDKDVFNFEKEFPWKNLNDLAHKFMLAYHKEFNVVINPPKYDYNYFVAMCNRIGVSPSRVQKSIGTLGGG